MRRVNLDGPVDLRADFHGTVVTVGSFDGVHVGHRVVLDRMRSLAEARSGESVVVTFDPHPRQVVDPKNAPPLLTTLEEKAWRIETAGIDTLVVVPFTQDVRRLDPAEFAQQYLVDAIGAEAIVIGYDHGFGRNRSGDSDTLQALGDRHGFTVHPEPATLVEGKPVSSTRIRSLIAGGRIEEASELLGAGYPVVGTVQHGEHRGRTIGFPTANVQIDEISKLLPPAGVYAGWAETSSGTFRTVINLGQRPTFEGDDLRLEAHLLEFKNDLYGTTLKLDLEMRLRNEQKFEDIETLKRQITADVSEARSRLSGRNLTSTRR